MTFFIKLYLLTVPIFFAVDLLWLGVIGRGFYQRQIGQWLAPSVNWPAAIAFYLIYIVGILYFAVLPGIQADSLHRALLNGALFGFFTYATYELTNLATHRDWPFTVVAVDILWGTLLCTAVSWGSFWVGKWLG